MKFFIHFLKNPRAVAALKPSSRALAKILAGAVDLSSKKCVVELGSGTGVFTQEIIKHISDDCIFFCMEINAWLISEAQKKLPDTLAYQASAEYIQDYLLKNNQETTDCVISAIPWATLDIDTQKILFNKVYESIDDKGEFLTIANVQGLLLPSGRAFRKMLEGKFSKVSRTKIVWMNVMPSFVYVCKK